MSTFLVFSCQFSCQCFFSRMDKPILLKTFFFKDRNVFTMVFDSFWQRYCRTKSCDFPSKLHSVRLWSDSWERKTPLFVCQDILGFCDTVRIHCRENTKKKKRGEKKATNIVFCLMSPSSFVKISLGCVICIIISTIYMYIYTHTYIYVYVYSTYMHISIYLSRHPWVL